MTGNAPMKVYRIYDDIDDTVTESEKKYYEGSKKKIRWIVASIVLLAVFAILTPIVNNSGYNPLDVLAALFRADTSSKLATYVWQVDMPIFVAALVAGAGLSLAGAVMQCILRNPLASPYTLGLSNAAAFGAAFSMIFLNGAVITGALSTVVTPLLAFVFAMVATGIILVLIKVTKVSSETMVLAGIAVSAIFSAGITLMQYIADPVQLSAIVSWMFGSVSNTNWYWDLFLFNVLFVVALYFIIRRWDMNAMGAGDDVAKGLGVNTNRFLIVGLILSAVIAASVVSKFGVIAFVGLLGPHMARLVIGDDHRYLIPLSILFGSLIMVVANLVATNIIAPVGLPVGLLTALLGGPVFIYLLIRRYRA